MTDASRKLVEELAGHHVSFVGFVLLWFSQHELEAASVGVMEILGWAIVLAGGAVTFVSYFSD